MLLYDWTNTGIGPFPANRMSKYWKVLRVLGQLLFHMILTGLGFIVCHQDIFEQYRHRIADVSGGARRPLSPRQPLPRLSRTQSPAV